MQTSNISTAGNRNIYDLINRPTGTTAMHSNLLQLCNSQPQSDQRLIQEENENLKALISNLNKTISEPLQFVETAP
jgi:hypothetical protein